MVLSLSVRRPANNALALVAAPAAFPLPAASTIDAGCATQAPRHVLRLLPPFRTRREALEGHGPIVAWRGIAVRLDERGEWIGAAVDGPEDFQAEWPGEQVSHENAIVLVRLHGPRDARFCDKCHDAFMEWRRVQREEATLP